MKTDPLRFLAGSLAALVLTTAASGYTYLLNSNTGLPLKWPEGTVKLRLMLGTSPVLIDGTNYSTSAQGAADTWNALLGSMQFQSTIATGTASDRNRVNELAFAADIFGQPFDKDATKAKTILAVTTTWSLGNQRTEGDIIFNTAWKWDSYPGDRRPEIVDLHRVALHEMGHLLGLDHPDEASQTVSAIMNSHISNIDTLTMDDISGAQNLYGPPGPPLNDNFANATVIGPLNSANRATLTGFNTLATKETGEPNHAGNIGGHSAWWKWTAPGDGSVTLDTRGSYYDTSLGVYTGTSVSALTTIASNDDINPGVVQASTVTFNATAGTVYYFAVDGFDADTGGITLNLALTATGATLPTITTQPVGVTAAVGEDVSFNVVATAGSSSISYQWMLNGAPISGATAATLSLSRVTSAQAGSYTVTLTTGAGSVTSNSATLTVNPASPPAFATQPVSQSVTVGASVTFSVGVSGLPAPTLQWRKDGVNISGATSGSYTISSAAIADAGDYSVVATNASGSVTSNLAKLSVTTPVVTPPPSPSSSGGGGGGAPSLWFMLVLGAAGLARLLRRR